MIEASQQSHLLNVPNHTTSKPCIAPLLILQHSTHLTPCPNMQQGRRCKHKPHILQQYILTRMARIRKQNLVEGKRRNIHPDTGICTQKIHANYQFMQPPSSLLLFNILDFSSFCVLTILVVDVGLRQVFFYRRCTVCSMQKYIPHKNRQSAKNQ